jgi:pilus assembly protein CpaC
MRRFDVRVLAALMALATSGSMAEEGVLSVGVNQSSFILLPAATDQITVSDPSVVDVIRLDPTHLYILGKSLGRANVVLCSKRDACFRTVEVEVTHDLEGLKSKLYQIFPEEDKIKVLSSQGSIVLAGQVSSLQKMDGIIKIANTFLLGSARGYPESRSSLPPPTAMHSGQASQQPGAQSATESHVAVGANIPATPQAPSALAAAPLAQHFGGVINLMQVGGPQQVMLGVTVAEINRRVARNFKVDFSAIGGSGDFSAGAIGGNTLVDAFTHSLAESAASAINPYGMFFRFIGHDVTIKTVINAAKENGLAKILAEPNLTVISGQDADFLSGGEFPVPVPQGFAGTGGSFGGITIHFKPFGVMLKFLPVVLDTGRISLKLNIDVSELSTDNPVTIPAGNSNETFVIPSLVKRSANSTLELDDGQTLGIAGLISDKMHESISKFPGLGDIPVLGQLFTSQKYLNDETELVIFVTPHLVKPIAPDKMQLPTDKFVAPNDMEYYLMGRSEGQLTPARAVSGQVYTGGLRGHFGQQP